INSVRPYASQFPNLGAINEVQSVGNSYFDGLLASLRATNFHGFTIKASYTFGHSIDNLSYARGIIPQNSYCLSCDWGNSDFDIRSSFSTFVTYKLPEPTSYKMLLGGWQLNSLLTFYTGTPFTVGSGTNSSNTFENNDRAEVVANPFSNVPASDQATQTYYWFNPNAFATPTTGTYSNQGRNEFYGPPLHQIDFSMFKNIRFGEHVTAQLRAEIYNIFNFLDLGGPSSNGQIHSTADVAAGAPGIGPGAPRNVQLALKILF
ncbi:MAG: hypothetical protein WA324_11040, partial [Bryobacteraceae bacterium]